MWLHDPTIRRVSTQTLVTSFGLVIRIDEFVKEPSEVALAKSDDVVEQFTTNRAYDAFDVWRLPRRARRDDNFLDAHVLEAVPHLVAVNAVAITN